MKKNIILWLSTIVLVAGSCKESFLEVTPQAQLAPSQLANLNGVENALIGSYTMLNGSRSGTWGTYGAAPSFWVWGEVAADNAHKGSDPGDLPEYAAIETHNPISTNPGIAQLWQRRFEGVLRTNNTLKLLAASPDEVKNSARGIEIAAEARFLRAHYYFDLWKVFKYVPYVTEADADPSKVPNDDDILPKIQEDFEFAEAYLPVDKPLNQAGRVNKKAAKAYLGKIYLYQNKYAEALDLFNEVINSSPDLETLDFRDNFDVAVRNGPESVFAVQHSVQDGTNGARGNVGDMLNAPFNPALPVSCCGAFTPSFDLVNAYKVTEEGLPDFENHHNSYFPSSFDENFQIPVDFRLDPRLDYTVGRQGIPYRDWGPMEGNSWVRNPGNSGPFLPYKNVTDASKLAANTEPAARNINNLNIHIIRLADVYLMAAECLVHTDLNAAMNLVNKVRRRAANLPAKRIVVGGVERDAANYSVGLYTSFPDKDFAMKAIQWERRLELAMEGHRFFDLRRWGILKSTLDEYAAYESQKLEYVAPIPKNDYFYPIPQTQIDNSNGVLKQKN
jgi:tetratricopeptide (TPR) repeat protein